jgi:RNA-directed DNA polymerase
MICIPVIIGNRELNRFTRGWLPYFRLADTGNLVREVDRWLRRRLRQVRWKEWKTTARRQNLRIRGIPERNVRKWGGSGKGYWRLRAPRSSAWPCPIPTENTSA